LLEPLRRNGIAANYQQILSRLTNSEQGRLKPVAAALAH
jgi:hypothetical protein